MSIAFDEPDLDTLVRKRIEQWRSGQAPDAAAFLDEHPELRGSKSLVLDLIYEEICLRSESGDTIVKSTIYERFPAYRQSIVKMLEVKEYLDRCPPENELAACRWPEPGEHFMACDIIEPLGRGALARVYLACQPALGNRPVVVKVSRYGASEARTLGKLSHPSIVPIHSVQHDDETGWTTICMPLVGTATVVDLLDAAFGGGQFPIAGDIVARVASQTRPVSLVKEPPPASEVRQWRGTYADAVARLGLHLAEALQAAHSAGVMHRDIKPSNVLLSWSGRPMLLDFNLSSDEGTATERIGGTLAYMAPELISSLLHDGGAAARQFDPRPDIYSLGAVLYELLAGKLPARPEDADALPVDAYAPWLESKLAPLRPLSQAAPNVDGRLEAIVHKCLAADPAERYASAADLARDLRAYLAPLARGMRQVKRRPGATLSAVLLLAAVIAGTSAFVASLPSREERLLAAAASSYEQGDAQAAETYLREIIAFAPDSFEARFALAQTLRAQERWMEARDVFLSLSDYHPEWTNALAGDCAFQDKRWVDANGDFQRAHTAGNYDPRFLVRYAYSARQAGQSPFSFYLYGLVLDKDPDYPDALRGRAMAYWASSGNGKRLNLCAVDDAVRACQADPGLKSYYIATLIHARAAKDSPQYFEDGVRYLEAAIRQGLPAHVLDRPELEPLRERLKQRVPDIVAKEDRTIQLEVQPDEALPLAIGWTDFLAQIGTQK